MVLTKCPKCDGAGRKTTPLPDKTHTVISGTLPCDQCSGTGVVVADLLSTRVAPNPGPVSVIENWGEGLSKNEAEALWYTIVKALPTIAEADVDRVAAEDCAKLLDAANAENADLKCRLDVLHRIFLDYSIDSDTTLRDVVERLTSANTKLSQIVAAAQPITTYKKESMELAMIRAMLKSRVPVGQSTTHLDEHDGCGAAVSALLSYSDELAAENQDLRARCAADDADSASAEAWERSWTAPFASAAERAAGKVSGPAQAALLALAVELRRGT